MIGGQYRDITGDDEDLGTPPAQDGETLRRLVGLGLRVAGVSERNRAHWRGFGAEIGLLFQVVDDILDEDGLASRLPAAEVRRLADDAANRARPEPDAIPGDMSVTVSSSMPLPLEPFEGSTQPVL